MQIRARNKSNYRAREQRLKLRYLLAHRKTRRAKLIAGPDLCRVHYGARGGLKPRARKKVCRSPPPPPRTVRPLIAGPFFSYSLLIVLLLSISHTHKRARPLIPLGRISVPRNPHFMRAVFSRSRALFQRLKMQVLILIRFHADALLIKMSNSRDFFLFFSYTRLFIWQKYIAFYAPD